MSRVPAALAARALGLSTQLIDALPAAAQYGIGRRVRNKLLSGRLPCIPMPSSQGKPIHQSATESSGIPVLLVTGSLGTGGVEAVVALLATEFRALGLTPVVLCAQGGNTAERLSLEGVEVLIAPDRGSADSILMDRHAIAVAQLHNPSAHLVDACVAAGLPLVQVVHNTDVFATAESWERETALLESCDSAIAVSEVVRRFYLSRLPRRVDTPVAVIPNGVASGRAGRDREESRALLGDVIGVTLGDATVFVCLARYELQKNIPGLVSSFLRVDPSVHLVVAGPTDDWLEVRRAQAICRADPTGGRIHLLGTSESGALMAAADGFLLDSFFEGWPIAGTEAIISGLPVVLAEVGGAAELAAQGRGVLISNPAVDPESIDGPAIRGARAAATNQRNRSELKAAVEDIHSEIAGWREQRARRAAEAAAWATAPRMAAAHAEVLTTVVPRKS